MATLRKLECVILQPSHERVVAVCNILDNLHSDDCKFCNYIAAVQVLVGCQQGIGMWDSILHSFFASAVAMKIYIYCTF